MKNIIAFAGSNSALSINLQLVKYTCSLVEDVNVEFLNLNDFEMPLYSIDRENESGILNEAHLFRNKMNQADAIVCSLAEHNRTYTAAFKNLFDWCSRVDMNIFANKPMFLMSTSPGGFGGGNVMAAAKSFFPKAGANIIDTFSLPKFYENFKEGAIIDKEIGNALKTSVTRFKEALE